MANTTIYGALGIPDTDYAYLHTFGQTVVYDATMQVIGDHNEDLALVQEIFVEAPTEAHVTKYKLDGQGRLQRRARQSRAAEVKATGEWSVAFPLEDFGAAISVDDVSWAYMTTQSWQRQLNTVMNQDRNTFRFEILRAIFNNTVRTFVDENWGNLAVQPLANGDAVAYPPVIGSEQNATANHYLSVAASAVAFTDSNNPFPAIVNTLEQHFGTPTGGSEIVIFVNNAQTAYAEGLAEFQVVPNRFVTYGANANLVMPGDAPPFLPGRVIGECNGAIIVEWRWVPAGYMFGVHLGAPRPLIKRVDPAATGLATGLQMVAADQEYPFYSFQWRNRYGLGVGNRLNGVAMDLTAAGGANTYTIPSQFA